MRNHSGRVLVIAALLATAACHFIDDRVTEDGGTPGGSNTGSVPTAFWYDPQMLLNGMATPVYVRADLPGAARPIALPRELGDGIAYEAVHFANANTGVALVFDTDGASAHVLTYDAPSNAWRQVARVVDPLVIANMPFGTAWQNSVLDYPSFIVRSWADGSYVAALAVTDRSSFAQRLWSVSSVTGAPPQERWTDIVTANKPSLAPEATMVLNLVGAVTPSRLTAVATTAYGHAPEQVAFLSVDSTSGAVDVTKLEGVSGRFQSAGYTGVDDYVLGAFAPGCNPLTSYCVNTPNRYCRATGCSDPLALRMPSVGDFPFAVLESSATPVPWVKLADLRGASPVVHTVTLPTQSTEMKVWAVLPDPRNLGWVRIFAFDSDLEGVPVEFQFKPETGEVTRVTSDALYPTVGCLFDQSWPGLPVNCFNLDLLWQWPQATRSFFFPATK